MADFSIIDILALVISLFSVITAGLSIYFNVKNNKTIEMHNSKIQEHNSKIQENNSKIQENNKKIQDLQQHREESKLVPKIKGLKIKRKENDPTLAIEIMNVGNYRARNLTFKIEDEDITLCSVVDEENNPIEIAPGGNYFFYTTIPWKYLNNDTYNVNLTWEDDHGEKYNHTKVEIFGPYK